MCRRTVQVLRLHHERVGSPMGMRLQLHVECARNMCIKEERIRGEWMGSFGVWRFGLENDPAGAAVAPGGRGYMQLSKSWDAVRLPIRERGGRCCAPPRSATGAFLGKARFG
jgi:hypothetical protein